jgi:anti-sigma factor RsiW
MQHTCDEALITAYAMGELSGPSRERAQAMLAASPARRRELAEIREVMGLLEEVHRSPAEVHREPATPKPRTRSRGVRGTIGAAALAAGLLLAFLLATILSPGGDQRSAVPSLSSVAEASVYRNADAGPAPEAPPHLNR